MAIIPAYTGETVRATITVGEFGKWYSVFVAGGTAETVGSVTGDLQVDDDPTHLIERVWWLGGTQRDFRINSRSFDVGVWHSAGEATLYLHIGTDAGLVSIPFTSVRSAGSVFLNLTATAAQAAILDTVGVSVLVHIVVATNTLVPTPPTPIAGPPYATINVSVDLNGDDVFEAGTDEDVTDDVRASPGLRIDRGHEQIAILAPTKVGTMDFELDNRTDQYGTQSDLKKGRRARAAAAFDGDTFELWNGYLDKPRLIPDLNRQVVEASCLGIFTRLQGTRISTALYKNITTDVAIGHVADAVGWPTARRRFDTGRTMLSWWWLDDEDALEALRTLVRTEGPGASAHEGVDGYFEFNNRERLFTATRSQSSQVIFRDFGEAPLMEGPLHYDDGALSLFNSAAILSVERSAETLDVVWEQSDTISIGGSETVDIDAKAIGRDPFTAAVVPVQNTDFTVNAGSIASVTLDRTSGAKVQITFTAGVQGATLSSVQMRARPVTVDSDSDIRNTVDASQSISDHGERPYVGSTHAEISRPTALALANGLVYWYRNGRVSVHFGLTNSSDEAIGHALSRALLDRITVVEASQDIYTDFWITQITHRFDDAYHQETRLGAELTLEPPGGDFAIWGTAIWGTSSWAV